MALFVVLSLLLTIPAFAEEGLALDGLLEAMEGTGVPENPAKIDLADGALVGEAPNAEANAESVKINKANFPEKDFRKYVKIHFDPDGDGNCPRRRPTR